MPCYVCNPQCGRCRPPRPKPVRCAACGKLAAVQADALCLGRAACPHCGAALPVPEGVPCRYTGRPCLVPCVHARELPSSGLPAECPWGSGFGYAPPNC